MTESTENLEVLDENGGAPIQPSSGSDQAPSSPADAKIIESLTKRLAMAEGEIKGLKSEKDKSIVKVATGLAETKEQINTIKKLIDKGLDEDEIAEKLAIRRLLQPQDKTSESEVAPEPLPGKQEAAPKIDREAIAIKNGIDVTSTEYVEIAKSVSDEEYISQLVALATGRYMSPQLPTNPANILPASPTGGSIPKATPDDYIKAMKAARGQGPAVGRQIQEKYLKLGVDVYNIPLA